MGTVPFSGDNPDLFVALSDYMAGNLKSAVLIIHNHRRHFRAVCIAIGHHCRNRQIFRNAPDGPLMGGNINNALHLFGNQLPDFILDKAVIVVPVIIGILIFFKKPQINQKNLVIFLLTVLRDSVYNIRNTEYRHIFHNNSDAFCIFRFQISCNCIRRII